MSFGLSNCRSTVVRESRSQSVQVYCQGRGEFIEAVLDQILPEPFDLALLRLTHPNLNSSCVYLDKSVQPNDPLYSYGYSDILPDGDPVTLYCEGISGGEVPFIKFKAGQVRPGLSGSPLLNLRTRKVCGIVKFTRDRTTDLGGGGIPTSLILEKFPTLEGLQQYFHQQDPSWIKLLVAQGQQVLSEGFQSTYDTSNPRRDWGDAPGISVFFGRTSELENLTQWAIRESCRLIVIVGMKGIGKTRLSRRLGQGDIGTSGIGKTDLSLKLAYGIEGEFDYVIWRSLRDKPPISKILTDLIKFLSVNQENDLTGTVNDQISRLLHYLRQHRCLLILDNLESLLQGSDRAGQYLNEYEDYGFLFEQIGEVPHKSCLILTSREKPRTLKRLEGKTKPVRFLELTGLNYIDGQKIFEERGNFYGSDDEWKRLIEFYNGNPLALELAAIYIKEDFEGRLSDFFKEGKLVFDDMRQDLLDWHFERLSTLEKEIMYWFAINREPVSINQLREDILSSSAREQISDTLRSLQKRLPLERSILGFTLQPVLMEYITERFIDQICEEIRSGEFNLFINHALTKALSKDFIRESQSRILLKPITERLIPGFGDKLGLEIRLNQLIISLKEEVSPRSGYAAGNIVNLLCYLHTDLRGYDFSSLVIWQAYFQKVNLYNVNFRNADLTNSVFTQNFRSILSATFSPDGDFLVTGDAKGEVRAWRVEDGQPIWVAQGHTRGIRGVAISHSGHVVASASFDQTVKLWDAQTGRYLRTLEGHSDLVRSVSFNPDDRVLASSSDDFTVKLWNTEVGDCLTTLQGHTGWVRAVAFSPNGLRLASASEDCTVKLWSVNTGECLTTLQGHTRRVHSVAFSPDETLLASGSDDLNVKLWDVQTSECIRSLRANTAGVWSVIFSSDGETIAAGNQDGRVRIWDVQTGECLKLFLGHVNGIRSVEFSPDGTTLASGCEDQTVKLWDVRASECIKTWQGCTNRVWSVGFSPDGEVIVSGNEDQTVKLWHVNTGECFMSLSGHINGVQSVAFSPDGKTVASGSFDQKVKLWDVQTGRCFRTFEEHTDGVWSVDFHPDGKILASSGYDQLVRLWDIRTGRLMRTFPGESSGLDTVTFSPNGQIIAIGGDDQTVKLWDIRTGACIRTLQGHVNGLLTIAFSPDARLVASSGYDQTVKVWDVQTGECLRTFQGDEKTVLSVAFSPDSQILVSVGNDQTVRFWNVQNGECLRALQGHTNSLRSVAYSPSGEVVASGGEDETIRLWDANSGECLRVLMNPMPYEGMDITGTTGLTEAQKITLRALGAIDQGG